MKVKKEPLPPTTKQDDSDPDAPNSDIDVDEPDDDTVIDLSSSGCCSWCHKPGPCALISDSEILGGRRVRKRFCSERCFGLHRRAMFKKNKRCEWCHTGMNEAETSHFGLSGLQFCRYARYICYMSKYKRNRLFKNLHNKIGCNHKIQISV